MPRILAKRKEQALQIEGPVKIGPVKNILPACLIVTTEDREGLGATVSSKIHFDTGLKSPSV